jgi:UDP-glucose 4-epimerase
MDIGSSLLEQVFRIEKPEIVNHLAAQKSVTYSVIDPMKDAEINIKGLLNVLKNSVQYKVGKFIFASSGGAIYGDTSEFPTSEESEPKMMSPYAISKYTGEKYVEFFRKIHGLNYSILRLANVYGPRQDAQCESGVIPIFLNNLYQKLPSTIFRYMEMPKGSTRDFVFVEDVARVNLKLLNHGENEIFNIGSGKEVYIADLYKILEELTGIHLSLLYKKERPGEVKRSVLKCEKVFNKLGWEARTTLREGLMKILKYSYIK